MLDNLNNFLKRQNKYLLHAPNSTKGAWAWFRVAGHAPMTLIVRKWMPIDDVVNMEHYHSPSFFYAEYFHTTFLERKKCKNLLHPSNHSVKLCVLYKPLCLWPWTIVCRHHPCNIFQDIFRDRIGQTYLEIHSIFQLRVLRCWIVDQPPWAWPW